MDLYAYAQINDLQELLEKNEISVPRLRGLRLMGDEVAYTKADIQKCIESKWADVYEDAITACVKFRPNCGCYGYGPKTNKLKKKYLIYKTVVEEERKYEKVVGIRWDLIHGKHRKEIKFALKTAKKRVLKNLQVFNKYVGRDDVIYIHARIGGDNWCYYEGYKLEKEPWFLEKVDDMFDSTYCDIYAKIK